MQASIRKIIFAPALIVFGFMTLFLFQNCSSDVGFDSRPSAELPNQIGGTSTPINPNGTGVGGNSDVTIILNETPANSTVGDAVTSVVDYGIKTNEGTITSVQCTLDGAPINCNTEDRIPITNVGVGTHTFTINATNTGGKIGEETITWVIYNAIDLKTRDIHVNAIGDKVDIIINVDNSGSMEYEQNSMASRIASFMAPFAGLDYHIAVTTTSPIGNSTIWKPSLDYVDGKFVELESGVHCIKKSTHTLAQAQALIQKNVVRDLYLRDDNGAPVVNPNTLRPYPEGNGWERGIFTTYRAFERSVANNSPESGCLRQDVAKHVIVISDERETLKNGQGDDLPDQLKSQGAALRAKIAELYGAETLFKFHSIIVNPYTAEGEECLRSHGARPGVEYGVLSQQTGGFIGSVCAADYSTQLGQIGQVIYDSNLSYPLGCVAVEYQGQMGGVIDLATNNPVSTAFTFSGDKVEFATQLSQGDYRISYYCYR